ncbi:MAG: InlB B-repeat-containing protein [Chitinispirillales bacterium]|nr:InlB B-repeat-containing protein [Chitinispirillales bacterium]
MKKLFENKAGYSLVEVIVAMVGLSLVVLLLTSVITTSIRTQSAAREADFALMAAKAKMNELTSQEGILVERNSSGQDQFAAPNSSIYVRYWEVGDGSPIPLKVRAWLGGNSAPRDTVTIFGYLDPDNLCDENTPAPNRLVIIDRGADTVITPSGTNTINIFVYIDEDAVSVPAMDLCKIEAAFGEENLIKRFIISGADADKIDILAGKIKLTEELTIFSPSAGEVITFNVEGENCKEETGNSQIVIVVKFVENSGAPEINFTQISPFFEYRVPGLSSVTPWGGGDKVGDISPYSGNFNNAHLSVEPSDTFLIAGNEVFFKTGVTPVVDYNLRRDYTLKFSATKNGDTRPGGGSISITEVNKAPTGVDMNAYPSAYTATAGKQGKITAEVDVENTPLGRIVVSDPNVKDAFRFSRLEFVGGDISYFKLSAATDGFMEASATAFLFTDSARLVLSKDIPADKADSDLSIKVRVENVEELQDGNGGAAVENTFVFEVVEEMTGYNCDTLDAWSTGSQYNENYPLGRFLKYNNNVYKVLKVGGEYDEGNRYTLDRLSDPQWYENLGVCGLAAKNKNPSDITLSLSSSVLPKYKDDRIGTLGVVDFETQAASTYTYSLVAGTGGDDNAKFKLTEVNNIWYLDVSADAIWGGGTDNTEPVTLKIRVRVDDSMAQTGIVKEKEFLIDFGKGNRTPSLVYLNQTLTKGIIDVASSDMTVGTLRCSDYEIQALSTYSYAIAGGADAANFKVVNDSVLTLKQGSPFTSPGYKINVKVTDASSTESDKTRTDEISLNVTFADCPTLTFTPLIDGNSSKSVIETDTYAGRLSGASVAGGLLTPKYALGDTPPAGFSVNPDGTVYMSSVAPSTIPYHLPVKAFIACPDGTVSTQTGSVAINVGNAPCDISGTPTQTSFKINKGATVVGTIGGITGPSSLSYTLTQMSGPTSGALSINNPSNGNISIISSANPGTYVFTVRVESKPTVNTSCYKDFTGLTVEVLTCGLSGGINASQSFTIDNSSARDISVSHNVKEATGTTINWRVTNVSPSILPKTITISSSDASVVKLNVPSFILDGTYTVDIEAYACSPEDKASGSITIIVQQTCDFSGTFSAEAASGASYDAGAKKFTVSQGKTGHIGTLKGLSGGGFRWNQVSGSPNIKVGDADGKVSIPSSLSVATYNFSVQPKACGDNLTYDKIDLSVEVKVGGGCESDPNYKGEWGVGVHTYNCSNGGWNCYCTGDIVKFKGLYYKYTEGGDAHDASHNSGGPYNPENNPYVRWSAITCAGGGGTTTYNVTFDCGSGASNCPGNITGTTNSSLSKPSDPTKSGSTFAGWSLTSGGTVAVSFPYTLTQTNTTLYAIWIPGGCGTNVINNSFIGESGETCSTISTVWSGASVIYEGNKRVKYVCGGTTYVFKSKGYHTSNSTTPDNDSINWTCLGTCP